MGFLPTAALGLAVSFMLTSIDPVHAQFVKTPTDLNATNGFLDIPVRYKEVPSGICESTPGVKSYSGYVTVAPQQHLFFWFFEAREADPTTAPLTTWINGGPGSSSMLGLFQENGPCGVDYNGTVYYNPYSYNNVSNMLYIDQPTQTGLSYSKAVPAYVGYSGQDIVVLQEEDCPEYGKNCGTYSLPYLTDTVNSTVNGAPSFWRALQGFMGAFPQYSRNGFHMTTESYGGHYGPIYMEYFESQNELIANGKLQGAHHIELESVMIGNGWYDPLIQYGAYYNFTVSPGNTYGITIPKADQKRMFNNMYGAGNCRDRILQCASTGRSDVCSAADNFCAVEVEELYDFVLGRDEYDSRELEPARFPYGFFSDYLNTPKVQQAIGAFVNYTGSAAVGQAFGDTGDDNREEGTVAACRALIQKGVYMVQYDGDADYNCNWLGTQQVAAEINAPGFSSAGFYDLQTSDHVVHGQSKQADNYAFVRVYESGHEVPFYQPLAALTMFNRTINGMDVATGKQRVVKGGGFRTKGPSESKYREGGGTVVHHKLPADATYNTTTNRPNPVHKKHKKNGKPPGEGQDDDELSAMKSAEQRRLRRRMKAKPPMKLLLGRP